MADFDTAVTLVLKHERGYVWNMNDPGGPTNYGITLAVYQRFVKPTATADDIRNMSVVMAKSLYRSQYWKPIGGDSMACQELANWVLDMAVLRGVGAAAKTMQQALGLTADGVVGPNTLAALNRAPPAMFLNVFRSLCVRAFGQIVTQRPASLEFLSGWLARAEAMTDTVSVLSQRT